MLKIDLNCDMGESYGRFEVGNDTAIFPYITSANIACGFHSGDPLHIENTIKGALENDVQVGAHPGYPDLQGFGRRRMQMKPDELRAMVKYQIAALKSLTESLGGKLAYVKPHGALYNTAVDEEEVAISIIKAIQEIDGELAFMGLAGSQMQDLAKANNIRFIAEAFADRRYTKEGKLMSRALPGAVLDDANTAAEQVLSIVQKEVVETANATKWPLKAQSICIHGGNPSAIAILEAIHGLLDQHDIRREAF